MLNRVVSTYRQRGASATLRSIIWKGAQNVSRTFWRLPWLHDVSKRQSESRLEAQMANEQRGSLDSIFQTLNAYEGVGLYKSIKPLQNTSEQQKLIQAVNEQNPKTILEIGTANGGSLYPWCRYIDGVDRVIAVDIDFWGRDPNFYNTFVPKTDREFDWYMGNSHSDQLFQHITQDLDTGIDFLFIDGDHSYKGVKKDFQLYSKLVSSGGLIAFHDIRGDHERCGVGTLWNELKTDYSTQEFHDSKGPDEWGGIGVLTLE